MPYCPCCTDSLLHHIRGSESYWFCRSCWQEMPVLTQRHITEVPKPILAKLAKNIFTSDRYGQSYQQDGLRSTLEGKWERKIVSHV
ncbi:hypothetical protein IQ231_16220 [Cuspidothrix issatschenkoi LEGE 03284]|uniref:hypothetical protein n=1 Tax=Cuspidothrix issatschenkoi TaxID=230752 RepID=UPI00187FF6DD|nr:hypothetical protein [Cuspidothrix issatschenkoi]MBE9233177.1 hypothetical protein [Cuspidothrix issatschenkoi LEGE 03284]